MTVYQCHDIYTSLILNHTNDVTARDTQITILNIFKVCQFLKELQKVKVDEKSLSNKNLIKKKQ